MRALRQDTEITSQTPPAKLLKISARRNPAPKDVVEAKLKKELERCQLIQPGWQPLDTTDLQNDEICGELRIKLRQLRQVGARNSASLERLLGAAKQHSAKREANQELSGPAAKAIEDRYLKRKRVQKQRKKRKKKQVPVSSTRVSTLSRRHCGGMRVGGGVLLGL